MATPSVIANLRLLVNEPKKDPEEPPYTDQFLSDLIDASAGDLNRSALSVWEQKAAQFSEMMTITESGSTRNFAELHRNAMAMINYFTEKIVAAAVPVRRRSPGVRWIVRP